MKAPITCGKRRCQAHTVTSENWSCISCAGSPNPTGAPGIFDLTEVNAKSAEIGITNNSFTTDSDHKSEAIVIHKNAIQAIPGQMQDFCNIETTLV